VQAEIAVSVKLALVPEHPDLVVAGEDDPAITILELSDLTDELLGHADAPSWSLCLLYSVLCCPGVTDTFGGKIGAHSNSYNTIV
jgi:hypothetical protein